MPSALQITSPSERELAHQALATLAQVQGEPTLSIQVPASAVKPLIEILALIAAGESPRILSDDEELSTQEAADLMGISRPTLLKRLAEGELPYHWVGSHRRLMRRHVLRYWEHQKQANLAALRELVAEEEALGLRG